MDFVGSITTAAVVSDSVEALCESDAGGGGGRGGKGRGLADGGVFLV